MKSPAPFDKIELIRRSLRCFSFGLVALLPGIGFPFAIVAISEGLQIHRHKGSAWNPADRYVNIGAACACAGLLVTALLVSIIIIQICYPSDPDMAM